MGDLVEARNFIQFAADRIGDNVSQKCWRELHGANLVIGELIAGEVRFTSGLARIIQASFDSANVVVREAEQEARESQNGTN